ncbi:hypothetical protein Emag_006993 [Eimeria magna]
MERLGAGQGPSPEQEDAGDLPEGPSVASHHEDTAASSADSEDPYIEKATRATRSVINRRLLLGVLATVVLALVLATALRKRLPSVAKPSHLEAPEDFREGLPAVQGKPEATTTEEKGIPHEFKKIVGNIVEWARQAHTDKPLSSREAVEISLQQDLKRNGAHYTFTARFMTAADLAEGLPEFFAKSIALENGTSTRFSRLRRGFGDPVNGSVNVMVRRESFYAPSRFGPPLGAFVPMNNLID